MQRWLRRVRLYWNAPRNGWAYSRLEVVIEIVFMSLWSVMGLYNDAGQEGEGR
jgi:hypothetical protein